MTLDTFPIGSTEYGKVYIAGRITGDPNYRQKFNLVADKLEYGMDGDGGEWVDYVVLNPAKNPSGLTRAEYMRIDLQMIDMADAVIFLPDWEMSEGAKLEKHYCEYIGKPIFGWGY